MNIPELVTGLSSPDRKQLARAITMVENEMEGHRELLAALRPDQKVPVIGVTGPPGAGKSTLIDAMISELVRQGKKVAVIAIDPTSPFTHGSLLGDRVRMNRHFNDPNVFIRSLATRGSLGGLSAKPIEVCDVIRSAGFDLIFVETVGVGQSEMEIAGLADTTILVLVPESGDEVQAIKSGIMEIADIFVVNKSDREGADAFIKDLYEVARSGKGKRFADDVSSEENTCCPVIKAVATSGEGVPEILNAIHEHSDRSVTTNRIFLLAEKAFRLIQKKRMGNIDRSDLFEKIRSGSEKRDFNLYSFVENNF